jgi:hypothetical protein
MFQAVFTVTTMPDRRQFIIVSTVPQKHPKS